MYYTFYMPTRSNSPSAPTGTPTNQRGVVVVDLGARKAALQALCDAQGVSVSQFIRSAVLGAMDASGASLGSAAIEAPKEKPGKGAAMRSRELLLTQAEDAALMARADVGGYSFQGYLIALVRAHLGRGAQLGQSELLAVGESNRQMLDVAQQLRKIPEPPQALIASIKRHMKLVVNLIQRNEERLM